MTDRARTWIGLVSFAVSTGCAQPAAPTAAPAPDPAGPTDTFPPEPAVAEDPQQALADLETTLVTQEHRATFSVIAEGIVQASIRGDLVMVDDDLELRASGTMSGMPVDVELVADGERMRGTNGARSFDLPQDDLREAIAIGLVRMGILHNVAVLNGARPPDHADGGVRDWVERREATYTRAVTELEATRDDLPSPPVSMQIVVDGQPAGEATVWIDPSLGLPIERHQVVVFPEGEMRVRESYTWH